MRHYRSKLSDDEIGVEKSEHQCTTFSRKHDELSITLNQPLPNALCEAKYIWYCSSTPAEAESLLNNDSMVPGFRGLQLKPN